MTSAIRPVVDHPPYLSIRDQLQITAGLYPKSISWACFREMLFSQQKNTLTFIFEVLWKPPIYENIKDAFREYIGTLQAKKLAPIRQSDEVISRVVITVDIPLQNGRSVVDASFEDMKFHRNPNGISFVEFTVSVLLGRPKTLSEEYMHENPIYAEPIYAESIYENLNNKEPIYQIVEPLPPEINWDTFPGKSTSKRCSLELLIKKVKRFSPKCLVTHDRK